MNTILNHAFLSLLQIPTTVFGAPIRPVAGPVFENPVDGISRVAIFGIRTILIVGMVLVLIYLLWGALDWVTGGGDEEKLTKARQKITNAVLGILIMVGALGLFMVVSGDILGIIHRDSGGNWSFNLPTIGTCIESGKICDTVSNNRCCGGLTCSPSAPFGSEVCR